LLNPNGDVSKFLKYPSLSFFSFFLKKKKKNYKDLGVG